MTTALQEDWRRADARMMSEIMEVPFPRADSRRLISFFTFQISMFFSASFACCCWELMMGEAKEICSQGGKLEGLCLTTPNRSQIGKTRRNKAWRWVFSLTPRIGESATQFGWNSTYLRKNRRKTTRERPRGVRHTLLIDVESDSKFPQAPWGRGVGVLSKQGTRVRWYRVHHPICETLSTPKYRVHSPIETIAMRSVLRFRKKTPSINLCKRHEWSHKGRRGSIPSRSAIF